MNVALKVNFIESPMLQHFSTFTSGVKHAGYLLVRERLNHIFHAFHTYSVAESSQPTPRSCPTLVFSFESLHAQPDRSCLPEVPLVQAGYQGTVIPGLSHISGTPIHLFILESSNPFSSLCCTKRGGVGLFANGIDDHGATEEDSERDGETHGRAVSQTLMLCEHHHDCDPQSTRYQCCPP